MVGAPRAAAYGARFLEEDEVYADEPARSPLTHKVLTQRPYCSETRPEAMLASHLTPPDALYVRNHAPVPDTDDAAEQPAGADAAAAEQLAAGEPAAQPRRP